MSRRLADLRRHKKCLLKSANGRVMINRIGSEQGFLESGSDVFISKKDMKDYHDNPWSGFKVKGSLTLSFVP